jgi:hypothetical protein
VAIPIFARDAAGKLFQFCLTDPGAKKWECADSILYLVGDHWYHRITDNHIHRYVERNEAAKIGAGFIPSPDEAVEITREQARAWWQHSKPFEPLPGELRPATKPTPLNDTAEDASLRRLLERVARGTFIPGPGPLAPLPTPGALAPLPSAPPADLLNAQRDGLVAIDDDEYTLTEKGQAKLVRLLEGPDNPWAWPYRPFREADDRNCHNAQAKIPLTYLRNLKYRTPEVQWKSALPNPGEPFGVLIHDANEHQQIAGVGRQYYVPTADDLAILQEVFPNSDPENPSWSQIETDLVLAGKDIKELCQQTAATLIRLLQMAKVTAKLAAAQAALGKNRMPAAQAAPGKKSRLPATDLSFIVPPLDSTMGEAAGIPTKAPVNRPNSPNTLEIQRNNWIVREKGSGQQISDRLRDRIAEGNRIDPKPDYALWKHVGKNQVNEIKKTWTIQDEPPTD